MCKWRWKAFPLHNSYILRNKFKSVQFPFSVKIKPEFRHLTVWLHKLFLLIGLFKVTEPMCYWSEKLLCEAQTKRMERCDKQSQHMMVCSCQAGSCPHNVTHLAPERGSCCFSLTRTTTVTAVLVSHAAAFWNKPKLSQRLV